TPLSSASSHIRRLQDAMILHCASPDAQHFNTEPARFADLDIDLLRAKPLILNLYFLEAKNTGTESEPARFVAERGLLSCGGINLAP
ncbi:hypothetical protein, partial [Spongiibacter sp.]|uniref:hypothetical protein n=1 Tax=Spongiibacter sp. TaxID=2024860 RepID=UPI003562AFCF